MVCNVCYGADSHDGFRSFLPYFELQTVVIVYAYREISIVQCLEVERVEHKQVLYACSSHQRINALLVFRDNLLLETILLVRTFPAVILLF